MNMDELRGEIDAIDEEMRVLFEKRMGVSAQIAAHKAENHLPLYDRTRERDLLYRVTESAAPELSGYEKTLFTSILELSRAYQAKTIQPDSAIPGIIRGALANTPDIFPKSAVVACQGVEGAYSQLACDKLFSVCNIMFMNRFRGVFDAVNSGLCRYGVLPLENSTAGSVNEVYDLMEEYRFYIVRSVRLHIQHLLLALPGVQMGDVREIYSHSQALSQCSEFLKSLADVRVTPCDNTAIAAQNAAKSGRRDVAVISSEDCAELYGLVPLAHQIQNAGNNYTRFICISKKPEIYPGARRSSLMMTLTHRPGSLYRALSKLNALDINLIKLESRPLLGRDFEFMFYFDMDCPVYAEELPQVLRELESEAPLFQYLGTYNEI